MSNNLQLINGYKELSSFKLNCLIISLYRYSYIFLVIIICNFGLDCIIIYSYGKL